MRRPESCTVGAALHFACLLLACLPVPAPALAWEREAILAGQWWRLWSGHLVHFGLQHAFTDGLVLLAAGMLLERRIGPRCLLGQLAVAAPLVSLLLLSTAPGLDEYRGASGLAAMLAVAAGIACWPDAGRWRPVLLAGAVLFAAATGAAALGMHTSLSSLPLGIAVAWQAHLLGAACGIAAGLPARRAISVPHT